MQKKHKREQVILDELVMRFFVTLLAFIPSISLGAVEKGHDFTKDDCYICHLLAEDGNILKTKEKFTYQCGLCHNEVISSACLHKVNIPTARNNVPVMLPLSSSGEITCNTCHDVHWPRINSQGIKTHYLRNGICATDLCLYCHDAASMKHAGVLKTAHLRPATTTSPNSNGIDPLSMVCLSCHDGLMGQSQMPKQNNLLEAICTFPGQKIDHPVGRDYVDALRQGGVKNSLLPVEELNRQIPFFENKISCGSCHDPYSAKKKKLRVDNYRSKLCLSCHKR